jgi:pseudouridine-5'-phosphate glycosidase
MTTLRLTDEVSEALRRRRPVVALESSVLAQGLPIPANHAAAERMTGAVRSAGAVPAITAVVAGVPTVGLEAEELERFLRRDGVHKVAARDVPDAMARRQDGATTVSASLLLAHLAGITVFATGGIGGVHRDAEPAAVGATPVRSPPGAGLAATRAVDESADLAQLAATPLVVVCAGAKSILDLRATVERLETLGVPVVGYRTSELPGFYTAETGIPLIVRAESPGEIAELYRAGVALGRSAALLVVQPPPPEVALPRAEVEAAVERALARARHDGVSGGAVTPWVLAAVERETGGRSLGANLALLEGNARLAAEIAVAMSTSTGS